MCLLSLVVTHLVPRRDSLRRCVILFWVVGLLTFGARAQTEPYPQGVEERVKQATLIVVGKLRDVQDLGRHRSSCRVEVEQVLLGAIPTNKATLIVSYTPTGRFWPSRASKTKDESYLCFVTDAGVEQDSQGKHLTRAVGQSRYAHDAFELATEKQVWYVKYLIERQKGK